MTNSSARERLSPERSPRPARATWPGAWGATATALLSGLACWFWLLPFLSTETRSATPPASELAEVAPGELDAALPTTELPAALADRIRKDPQNCSQRLAWVALSRPPGGTAPEQVRIRSGTYFSPVIALPPTPIRVAIPYPAPYETGQGTLTILGATAGTLVALTPPWPVPPQTAVATRAVTWHPGAACPRK